MFGVQSTRKFLISPVSFLSQYARARPCWKVYFTTRDPLKIWNASVKIILKFKHSLEVSVIFINQNLVFIFIGKVGTASDVQKEASVPQAVRTQNREGL